MLNLKPGKLYVVAMGGRGIHCYTDHPVGRHDILRDGAVVMCVKEETKGLLVKVASSSWQLLREDGTVVWIYSTTEYDETWLREAGPCHDV